LGAQSRVLMPSRNRPASATAGRAHQERGASAARRPTRAELCGDLGLLQLKKQELRLLTQQQKRDLHEVIDGTSRLRASLASLDLAEAELAREGTSQRFAIDIAKLELEQLTFERRQLERELSDWRADAMALRSAREQERMVSEMHKFDEQRVLEAELDSLLRQIAAQEELLCQSDGELSQTPTSVSESLSHRQQQAALELELERMQAQLAHVRSQRQKSQTGAAQKLNEDRRALAEAQMRLASETEVRKAQALRLQAATSRLEMLRKEVQQMSSARAGGWEASEDVSALPAGGLSKTAPPPRHHVRAWS